MQNTTYWVICETMKNRKMVFHYLRDVSARGRPLPAKEYTRNGANKKFTSRPREVRLTKGNKNSLEKGQHQAGSSHEDYLRVTRHKEGG